LIFFEATETSVQRVTGILENYHKCSGQLVNKQKSTVFFSQKKYRDIPVKQSIFSLLSIPTEALGERQLGLPTTAIGRYLTPQILHGTRLTEDQTGRDSL
jgi:hypothetical protein